ncbi:MAG: hypothetical protein SFU98_04485 [Leptospiraceae bacterium]|nr:hypothetical protein [Leptospiraceae bacterium]
MLVTFIILTFLFNCSAENRILNDDPRLSLKNGVQYFNHSLFSGELVSFFKDGTKQVSIHYKEGLKDGKEIVFFANGKPLYEKNYIAGKLEGTHYGWHENGKPRFLSNFKNDTFDGDNYTWYPSGKLESYKKFSNDKFLGHRYWREDGSIFMNYIMKDDERIGLYGTKLCKKVRNKADENSAN